MNFKQNGNLLLLIHKGEDLWINVDGMIKKGRGKLGRGMGE